MPNRPSPQPSLPRQFFRFGLATFFVGGALWVWADLRQFEPITTFVAVESLVLWCTLGWMPSIGVGGLAVGLRVVQGGVPQANRRYGAVLLAAALALIGFWIQGMEIPVDIKSVRVDTAMYARSIRKAGQGTEPGEVSAYLETYFAPRSRYVALKTLRDRRDELRLEKRWSQEDLDAVEVTALESLQSSHRPLRELARETLVWATLEGMRPGQMAEVLDRTQVPPAEMISWLTDWEKPGRPRLEGQLTQADYSAVQDWASTQLPAGLPALRWALEQSGEGAVGAFLEREHTDANLSEVLRSWCTTEGWSPLLEKPGPSAQERATLDKTLERLTTSTDPVIRREAAMHQEWVARMIRTTEN